MKKLYTAQDPLMIGHLKNVLESYGIDCVIKNMHLTGAIGELPPIECWPELWVADEMKYAKAQAILEKTLSQLEAVKEPWQCRKCGEVIEGQFTDCWNCGSSQP